MPIYRAGKWNAAMPKQLQGAACMNICCGCFTGLAGGGALGPMPWGTTPGIPAAMGTRWAATGPRVSIALGSRPAGSKRLAISGRKLWTSSGNKCSRNKINKQTNKSIKVLTQNRSGFQKQLILMSCILISNYGSIKNAGTGNILGWLVLKSTGNWQLFINSNFRGNCEKVMLITTEPHTLD